MIFLRFMLAFLPIPTAFKSLFLYYESLTANEATSLTTACPLAASMFPAVLFVAIARAAALSQRVSLLRLE